MKKVLITGISGFAGSFLAEHLLSTSDLYGIHGTYLSDKSLVNLTSLKDKVNLTKLDLNDEKATCDFLMEIKPDCIFHLAALASAGASFKKPREYITNNISAQVNLFEAVRKADLTPKILIISSAEVYGNVRQEDLPIDEDTPLRPVNPYAVSKVAQDFLGLQYYLSYGLPIVIARPFNHIGPRQAPDFVVGRFSKAIADIEKGIEKPLLKVGNLQAKRDFTDVRDMVVAYASLMDNGKAGEVYNIGSGKSHEIKYILDTLLSFSNKEIRVEKDESLVRPIDVTELVSDNSKIAGIGWEPRISIKTTLKDTLDYWRSIT